MTTTYYYNQQATLPPSQPVSLASKASEPGRCGDYHCLEYEHERADKYCELSFTPYHTPIYEVLRSADMGRIQQGKALAEFL